MTSSAGNIEIRNTALNATPRTPVFVGAFPLDVGPGEKIELGGSWIVDYVRVAAGGTVRLLANTFLVVLGDVEIAGSIIGTGVDGDLNAYDLTIDADGYVNITGLVDCSGRDGRDRFNVQDPRGAGGDAAEIYISSALLSSLMPGPHIFISGQVLANGGETFATTISDGIPGQGGQILIGTAGARSRSGARSPLARESLHGSYGRERRRSSARCR